LQKDEALRPDFAAMIYGAPFGRMPEIPGKLPPMFMAWAQDDDLAAAPIVRFYDALKAAGHKPDVHIYGAGGHGFGMYPKETTSTGWFDAFVSWLGMHGMLAPSGS
jgi:acetyl esterase/lipase